MNKKDRKEFYIATLMFLALLTLLDVAFIKKAINSVNVANRTFTLAGMAQSQVGHEVLYFPVYKQGDRK